LAVKAPTITQHITASFKLHNPSARKREILALAFREYTLAYQQLLDWARANLDLIKEKGKWNNKYSEKNIRRLLPLNQLRAAMHSSLKDALAIDVASAITSYLQLLVTDPKTSFPTCRNPVPGAYLEALSDFAEVLDDEADYNWRRDQLNRIARGQFMPLYFSRIDGVPSSRNFSLLLNDDKKRYYALLFLLPDKHPLGGPLETRGNLRRLGWSSEADRERSHLLASHTRCGLLFPLEMGRWHESHFIERGNVRSAFLFERGGEFFLNVTFEIEVERLETRTFLGVDRGIAQLMALAVLSPDETVLSTDMYSGDEFMAFQWDQKKQMRRLQKRGKDVTGNVRVSRISDQTCHEIANRVVALAVENRAQVVLEELKGFDRSKARFYRLRAAPYQRIAQILDYKLPLQGLPPPKRVNPAYTSLTCPECSHFDKANRATQDKFRCVQCGHENHADLNGAVNIARRWISVINGKKGRI